MSRSAVRAVTAWAFTSTRLNSSMGSKANAPRARLTPSWLLAIRHRLPAAKANSTRKVSRTMRIFRP